MSFRRIPTAVVLTVIAVGCSKTPPHDAKKPPADSAHQESSSASPQAASRPAKQDKEAAARTFAAQLETLDRRIEGMRKVAEGNPRSPAAWERIANAYLTRARLSGDYDDYAKAEALIEKAFAIEDGYGPWMTRARLNYTLHRLDRVDADLERAKRIPLKGNAKRASEVAFAANLAMQRGRYEEARKAFEASLQLDENSSNRSSFAVFLWKTGEFDRAEELFRAALDDYHGTSKEPVAWTHLQLGLMDLDRGKYDEALVHYREAEAQMKGWWLVEEHIAEILTLTGKTEEAKKIYLDVIERTGNPEFMDAMAGILLEEGKQAEAKEYIQRADERYQELLAQYPEAAYGHALEHYLELGEDAEQALDMAKKNHALRPNAEAKILLAQAYLKAEKPREAKAVISQALRTPWKTADLHLTAAEVFEALGDSAKAERERAAAREINPRADS